ncbi:hypothetical protein EYS14_19075 [Alteromonadaceae bacterium M269]|nr:hypothetical protein EYS14_19075 [Alteromonadaceae bacterium M269]
MSEVLHFKTAKFDVSKERENPLNPIYGHSLLDWLRSELKDDLEISEPDAEDWGWYSELEFNGHNYLIGVCALFEKGDDPISSTEWVFQVDKCRSFKEKLLGKNKMSASDECFVFFKSYFEKQVYISEIYVG